MAIKQALYVMERPERFPGAKIVPSYLRSYPHGNSPRHALGFDHGDLGPAAQGAAEAGLPRGDLIGQSGVESFYDKYLRGTAGLAELRVDSLGRPRSPVIPRIPPHSGNAVRLTLDLKLQIAAEQALRYGIERARNSRCFGCWYSNAGPSSPSIP